MPDNSSSIHIFSFTSNDRRLKQARLLRSTCSGRWTFLAAWSPGGAVAAAALSLGGRQKAIVARDASAGGQRHEAVAVSDVYRVYKRNSKFYDSIVAFHHMN